MRNARAIVDIELGSRLNPQKGVAWPSGSVNDPQALTGTQ